MRNFGFLILDFGLKAREPFNDRFFLALSPNDPNRQSTIRKSKIGKISPNLPAGGSPDKATRYLTGVVTVIARQQLLFFFGFALLAFADVAQAQQRSTPFRIGFLSSLSPDTVKERLDAFRTGLQELGYEEGKNILIEGRYAEGRIDRLATLAAGLAHAKVDVIVTGGPAVNRFAKQATGTIPVVLSFDNDPVGNGFATSLSRPGGNITGLSTLYPEISGKQVELLRDMVPKLSRVATIGNSTMAGNEQAIRETDKAAKALGVRTTHLDVANPFEIETTFRSAAKERADAVIVLSSQIVTAHVKQFVAIAANMRLPTMYWSPEFVRAGGLVSYSVNINDLFRRAAIYVDKILKGAKPGELPIEQPRKFELVINLSAAKQIGLVIPPNVLARADRVIR